MTMLTKLFGPNKLKPSSLVNPAAAASAQQPPPTAPPPEPLRIIHAGRLVECYYMAVPAVDIIAKYPRSVLARPEIFRRPWESLVRPEEVLTPGEKFYIVPRGTVRKLQKRIRRQSASLVAVGEGDFSSKYSLTVKDRGAKTNMTKSTGGKPVAQARPQRRKKVRFVDTWQPSLGSIEETSPCMEV